MRQTGLFAGIILSVALGAAGCSQTANEREEMQDAALEARGEVTGEEVTVTGCLSGAEDRGAFVVTANRNQLTSGALNAGDGETPTYTYELTGNAADLAPHVGQEVEVKGRLDEDRDDDVKVDKEEEAKGPTTQSGDEKVTPAIETDTEMDINVRRLQVASVTRTGKACGEANQQ